MIVELTAEHDTSCVNTVLVNNAFGGVTLKGDSVVDGKP